MAKNWQGMSGKELNTFCERIGLTNADWDEGGGFVHEAVVRVVQKEVDEAEQRGRKKVVDYFSRHWMACTKGMMLYEIPEKDRDLLEDGIIPSSKPGE